MAYRYSSKLGPVFSSEGVPNLAKKSSSKMQQSLWTKWKHCLLSSCDFLVIKNLITLNIFLLKKLFPRIFGTYTTSRPLPQKIPVPLWPLGHWVLFQSFAYWKWLIIYKYGKNTKMILIHWFHTGCWRFVKYNNNCYSELILWQTRLHHHCNVAIAVWCNNL